MRNFQGTFYRVPESPLARFGLALLGIAILFGLALLGIAILAVSFFVGLVFLAVAAGLAILAAIGLTIRNWLTGGRKPPSDDLRHVEYRVIKRDQDRD